MGQALSLPASFFHPGLCLPGQLSFLSPACVCVYISECVCVCVYMWRRVQANKEHEEENQARWLAAKPSPISSPRLIWLALPMLQRWKASRIGWCWQELSEQWAGLGWHCLGWDRNLDEFSHVEIFQGIIVLVEASVLHVCLNLCVCICNCVWALCQFTGQMKPWIQRK